MHMLKLSFHPVRDGEVVVGTILKQRKRNDYWVNEETIVVKSDEPGSERQIMLEDNQRVMVEGQSNMTVVYDRTQNAAVPFPKKEPMPTPTPVSTDGDESPPVPADELAMRGPQVKELTAQEKRDAALTAARLKLKEATKSTTQDAGHPTEPGATVSSSTPQPSTPPAGTPPAPTPPKPTVPPRPTTGSHQATAPTWAKPGVSK